MSAGSQPGGRRRRPIPFHRSRWPGGWWILCRSCLPLALLLSSCAGSPWGERLAGSFPPAPESAPPDAASSTKPAPAPVPPLAPRPSPRPAAPTTPATKPSASPPVVPAPAVPSVSGPAASASSGSRSGPSPPAPTPQPFPYRVTLRLPQADPSAPAEAVTKALRAAGIPFEVETIERVPVGATPPAVRPAPPPR